MIGFRIPCGSAMMSRQKSSGDPPETPRRVHRNVFRGSSGRFPPRDPPRCTKKCYRGGLRGGSGLCPPGHHCWATRCFFIVYLSFTSKMSCEFFNQFFWSNKMIVLLTNFTLSGTLTHPQTVKKIMRFQQSHYIEFAQGDIFMEQKMWFGLVLGRMAILKKNIWGRLWATFEDRFFNFSGAKNFFRIFLKTL